MCNNEREITVGRAFYYMPTPICTMKISVEEKYNHEKMVETIAELEKVHSLINNVIVLEDNRLLFRNVGMHVPVIRYTEAEVEGWKEVYKIGVSATYDLSKEPGTKVAILEHPDRFDLLVFIHHIYGDGISIKILLCDLLDIYLAGKRKEPKVPLTDFGEEHLKRLFSVSQETSDKMNKMMEMWSAKKVSFDYDAFHQMNILHQKMIRQEVIFGKIEAADLQMLNERCREYNVTVNSALTTAIVAAIRAEESVNTIIPRDMRFMLRLKGRKGLANLVSSVNVQLQYKSNLGFWKNVSAVQSLIKAASIDRTKMIDKFYSFIKLDETIFGAGYFAQYGMYKDFEVIEALRDALGLDIWKETLDFSNVGELILEDESENARVSECYFIPNFNVTCDWGIVSVLQQNTLTLSLVYSSRRIPSNVAEETMKQIIECIRMNIQGGV